MSELSALSLAALILAAFVAGWVDAVVGGGGLIQLPALLIGLPSSTPPADLGTNKISSFWWNGDQLTDLRARIPLDWRTVTPLVVAQLLDQQLGHRGEAAATGMLPRLSWSP